MKFGQDGGISVGSTRQGQRDALIVGVTVIAWLGLSVQAFQREPRLSSHARQKLTLNRAGRPGEGRLEGCCQYGADAEGCVKDRTFIVCSVHGGPGNVQCLVLLGL